jgi:two-component system chemotaxis sensor kinase CheA
VTSQVTTKTQLNWIGHWKGEDRREEWVRLVYEDFLKNHPDVHIHFEFAQDIVGEKNKRKSAEHIADMIQKNRYDWDVIWLDDFIYNFVAGYLKDPEWGRKYLVDFEAVPGFKETQKDCILKDPAYRNQTGGMIVGPYVEGYLYLLWYNKNLADKLGLVIKEDGMLFDDFNSYVKHVYDYNKANHTSYAAIFESNDWNMCQNFFQSLLKSEFTSFSEANAEVSSSAKLAALKKTLSAFEKLGKYKPLPRAHDTKVFFETREEVLNDQALFYPNATWMYSHWAGIDKVKMEKMVPALLPTFRKTDHYMGGYLPTWAVLKNAPHRDMGIKLLMTMCQEKYARLWIDFAKCPTGIKGDRPFDENSSDRYEKFQSLASQRFGARIQFSSTPAYFLGKENALLEKVVNSTMLKLLEGRIGAADAFSLIQSKRTPVGRKYNLLAKVGLGILILQSVTLGTIGLLFKESIEHLLTNGTTNWILFTTEAAISALLATGLGVLLIHALIMRRLKATLACVERVEKGERQHRIDISQSTCDEMDDLQRGVNLMIDSLESNLDDVQHIILDNVKEGFFRVDPDCRMKGERSTVLESWFGEAEGANKLSDYIRRVDPERADYFEMSWNELIEGILPIELLINQLPSRIRAGSKTLALRYRPVLEGREILEVIIVVSDVTAEVERERAEKEARNMLGMVRMILKDHEAFIGFAREGTDLVKAITERQMVRSELLRKIHTLKGNSALFELVGIAEFCHELESRLLNGAEMTSNDRTSLIEIWRPVAVLAGPDISNTEHLALDVARSEQAKVIHALMEGVSRENIVETIRSWSLEPVRRQFGRIADRAKRTAQRLGKGPIEVLVEDNDIRLPREEWSALWASFVHLIRNAVDHGLESGEERMQAGKNPVGQIRLKARIDEKFVHLEIADDGRGVDWETIRTRAAKLGIPSVTQEQLEQALFTDGLSSREVANEFSGRGVGLGAVRAACIALGGTISIQSEPKKGARILLCIPIRWAVSKEVDLPPVSPSSEAIVKDTAGNKQPNALAG